MSFFPFSVLFLKTWDPHLQCLIINFVAQICTGLRFCSSKSLFFECCCFQEFLTDRCFVLVTDRIYCASGQKPIIIQRGYTAAAHGTMWLKRLGRSFLEDDRDLSIFFLKALLVRGLIASTGFSLT